MSLLVDFDEAASASDTPSQGDNVNANEFDVVIVGGGPSGCVTALDLARRNIRTAIVEREQYPRFHIGESLTGECGKHLRQLGLEPKLKEAKHATKVGVRVYGKGAANSFWVPVMERTSEGLLNAQTTWHVTRSDFDDMLITEAERLGVTRIQAEALAPITDGKAVTGINIRDASGAERELRCKVLVDASGQSTYLAKHGVIGPKERGAYANQTAVFSQVVGTNPNDEHRTSTLIFYYEKHRWAWYIPLNDTHVSVGVVVPAGYLREHLETDGSLDAFLTREIRVLNPELDRRIPNTDYSEPVRTQSNYSYKIDHYTGPGYLCVGDSHQFIDPIFSYGVYVAIHEGLAAAEAIEKHLAAPSGEENPFAEYEAHSKMGQSLVGDMIEFFWEQPLWFAMMVNQGHRDEFIDYFAGRIYFADDGTRPGLQKMREALKTSREYADQREKIAARKKAAAAAREQTTKTA